MGRPKGGKNKSHSKAEKLELVKRNLCGESLRDIERETGIANSLIYQWTKRYIEGGEAVQAGADCGLQPSSFRS